MSSTQCNLRLAEAAVNHVATVMAKVGPANRPEHVRRLVPWAGPNPNYDADVAAMGQQLQVAVDGQRTFLDPSLNTVAQKTRMLWGPSERDRVQAALRVAGHIEHTGLGNCGEQSFVAFKYLLATGATGVAIVNWMSCNHMFVVVGMEADYGESKASLDQPPAWGAHAVVCDPWFHEWFSIHSQIDPEHAGNVHATNPAGLREWHRKMKRILAETRPNLRGNLDRTAAVAAGPDAASAYEESMAALGTFQVKLYVAHTSKDFVHLAKSAQPGLIR